MVGRGDRLTPYDDDVLCGWLAVHRAAGVIDHRRRRRGPRAPGPHHAALGHAAGLRDARRGRPRVRRLAGRPRDPERAARLAAVGHTSRRRMLHGARLALATLAPHLVRGTPHDPHPRRAPAPAPTPTPVTLLPGEPDRTQGLGRARPQVAMATALNVEVLTGIGFDVPAGDHQRPGRRAPAGRPRLLAEGRSPGRPRPAGSDPATRGAAEIAAAHDGERAAAPCRDTRPRRGRARLRAGRERVRPGDGRDRGRRRRHGLQRPRPALAGVDLKRAAADRGLLVMGPDCGTAVVGSVGLRFANVVSPGPVGVVAASAPAASRCSPCSTTPGSASPPARRRRPRPVRRGPRSRHARRCGTSTRTPVGRGWSCWSPKPPAPDVAATRDRGVRRHAGHPVEQALLGASRPDLTAATGGAAPAGSRRPRGRWSAEAAAPRAGAVRGLFVGGTLAGEARLLAAGRGAGRQSTFVDFGDGDGYLGSCAPDDRPVHPPGAPGPAGDRTDGVLLLDVVLDGHGASPTPERLAPAIAGSGPRGGGGGRHRRTHGTGPPGPALAGAGAGSPSNAGAARRAWPVGPAEQHARRRRERRRRPPREAGPTRPSRDPRRLATADGRHRDRPRLRAADPLRRSRTERALAAMLDVTATLCVDVAPASEVLGLQRGEFRTPGRRSAGTGRLNPLRRAHGVARRSRGPRWTTPRTPCPSSRPGRRSASSLPPPLRRSARWPAWSRRACGCSSWTRPRPRRRTCSLNEGLGKVLRYGAWGRVLEPAALDGRRARPAAAEQPSHRFRDEGRPHRRRSIPDPDADGRRGPQPQPPGT